MQNLASHSVDASTSALGFPSCINDRRSFDYATLMIKGCGIGETWGKSQPHKVLDMCPRANCPNSLKPCTLICNVGRVAVLTSRGCWQECTSKKLSECCLACTTYYNQNMAVNSSMLYSFIKTSTYFFSFDSHYHLCC